MPRRNLPPLPPSDETSLGQNRWDPNNRTRAYSFWKGNEVTHIKEQPFKQCKHKFTRTQTGVRCQKCHYGLSGNIEIQQGQLVLNGRLIEF